jgi:hypothetical protein
MNIDTKAQNLLIATLLANCFQVALHNQNFIKILLYDAPDAWQNADRLWAMPWKRFV